MKEPGPQGGLLLSKKRFAAILHSSQRPHLACFLEAEGVEISVFPRAS
jgi:hypothetical protein